MELDNINKKMEEELVRELERMAELEVGSTEADLASKSVERLYSAMATAKNNSDSIKVQADKTEFEYEKMSNEMKIREEQNKVTLIGCYADGCVALLKTGLVMVGALSAAKGVLNFEQTGCVTSKVFSWIPNIIFKGL